MTPQDTSSRYTHKSNASKGARTIFGTTNRPHILLRREARRVRRER